MSTGENKETINHARFPLARILGLALLVGVTGTMAPMTIRFIEYRAGNSITDDAFLEAQMVHVGPDGVSGRIVRVAAREDLFVRKGDILFELDADQYRDHASIAESKVRVAEGERLRQEIALAKLRRDVPLGIEEARQSLLLSKMTESRMEKVLRLTTDEVAGTVAESQALVGVAVANQTLAQQEYERFNALYKDNATTLRRSQEVTRTNETSLAELRLAHAKQDKATSSRIQIEVAAKDFEMARIATTKSALTVEIAENRAKTILEAEQALSITEEAANEARGLLKIAQRHLANTLVKAPISGIVVRRAKATGDHATMGISVVTMYDPDLLYVTANLEETRMRGVAAGNAGIIHQHIKPPMRGKHGRYGGFPLRFIRDIQVDVACGTAGLGDFSNHGTAFGFHHVGHHYLRAFTRQKQCGRGAHAGCRAGNQRNLIRNAHNISSWSFLIR